MSKAADLKLATEAFGGASGNFPDGAERINVKDLPEKTARIVQKVFGLRLVIRAWKGGGFYGMHVHSGTMLDSHLRKLGAGTDNFEQVSLQPYGKDVMEVKFHQWWAEN